MMQDVWWRVKVERDKVEGPRRHFLRRLALREGREKSWWKVH